MARYGYFCTKYLLTDRCDRGNDCIFYHVNKEDIQLFEPIAHGSTFVKGKFLRHPEIAIVGPSATKRSRTVRNAPFFCNYSRLGYECPYGQNCSFVTDRKEEMDGENSKPSTSTSSASASADDEQCLGAMALSPPSTHHSRRHNHHSYGGSYRHKARQLNIDAPEFVPRARFNLTSNAKKRLCPYAERNGLCKYPPGECTYLHGDMCDLCARPALHPHNEDLRKKHTQECIRRHERDMEIAFAVARSKEKVCGICFEVVMQKSTEEQRFGILPSCNHCFCLACIRRWRQSKQFENKIIRSCPECRIPSDFVCPSAYWVDTKEDKEKVIEKYKSALAKKDCKYFKYGRGHCPFGNKCFYRHCLQNGKRIDVGPPPSTYSGSDSIMDLPAGVEIIQRLLALEHVQEVCPLDELPDEMDFDEILQMIDITDMFFSDTDESYWSD